MPDNKDKKKQPDNPVSKPDPETLHKTDPQENMEGPISSIVQNIKEKAEENDTADKDKKESKWPDDAATFFIKFFTTQIKQMFYPLLVCTIHRFRYTIPQYRLLPASLPMWNFTLH